MDAPRRERKVVTVLFCDLVGFTSQAEALDPEDVEAILRPYHTRVRTELERHGGTVEKFIGDAVMALFGAPVAHEDDPERAVRAALGIRDFALEERLELRVGISTGEALVALDASPIEGEGMASGDVVNTAARLQAAAPVNGILTDETTQRATRQIIDYEDSPEVDAKGKTRPIRVWKAVRAHARFGVDVAHEARAGLVGRERELGVLRDAFDRARHERIPQLVTLVGVPGIGKSRLVYELSLIADADPELITWRQGRCLAYGDGVTLWALGEIVKAQAGVLEQDAPSDVQAKIHRATEDALAGSGDEAWVESRLLALVGLAGETELGDDRRNEAFAAWRRFLEALAEQRPLVLVFEDLHWADESLLDFVDELVDWVTDVPLLVVGTARPELLERRPGWGGGKLNATTLALQPLSDEQTALLIGQLLEKPLIAVESQQALLERAGGNPLYAEQFADLVLERGSTEELPLPETLQGIIAARLDGLPDGEKSLLQDAAVVGKVFWASALRRDPANVVGVLHALERKGFVRRQKRSSLEGESEFAFAHALVRDVAYGQIARPDRAAKHRRTAEWIEALGRSEDHAEMLAHHWSSALELERARGGDDGQLVDNARLALRDAGDRAFTLNSYAAAERYYQAGLQLWPTSDPERPKLIFRRAESLHRIGDTRREDALEEARDALLEIGDREEAAEAEVLLARARWEQGLGTAETHLQAAQQLVAEQPPSTAKARIYAIASRLRVLDEDVVAGLPLAREALAIAEALALDELQAYALGTVGLGKLRLLDSTGIADMERSVEIAKGANSPLAANLIHNLGIAYWDHGNVEKTREMWAEAGRLGARFGDEVIVRTAEAHDLLERFRTGAWEDVIARADRFIAECEAGSRHFTEQGVRRVRAGIRLARGDRDGALDDVDRALSLVRDERLPLATLQGTRDAASMYARLGLLDDARNVADEWLALARRYPSTIVFYGEALIAPFAKQLGIEEELRRIVLQTPASLWKDAELAVLDGELERAADIYASVGYRTWEAEIRLNAAEQHFDAARLREGASELQKALAFYRSVGGTLFIQRGEALLAKPA